MSQKGQLSTPAPFAGMAGCCLFRTIQYPPAQLERGGPTSGQGRRSQSEFNLLGDAKGVVHLDTEITDGAFEFRMPKQQLHGSQVTSLLVNLCGLGSPH